MILLSLISDKTNVFDVWLNSLAKTKLQRNLPSTWSLLGVLRQAVFEQRPDVLRKPVPFWLAKRVICSLTIRSSASYQKVNYCTKTPNISLERVNPLDVFRHKFRCPKSRLIIFLRLQMNQLLHDNVLNRHIKLSAMIGCYS